MPRLIKTGETSAQRRRVVFHLVGTDGITPSLTEAGGQPEISVNEAAFTTTGIGTLVSIGNGRYYGVLSTTVLAAAGDRIETRYKSVTTAECPGDSVLVTSYDPASELGDVSDRSVLIVGKTDQMQFDAGLILAEADATISAQDITDIADAVATAVGAAEDQWATTDLSSYPAGSAGKTLADVSGKMDVIGSGSYSVVSAVNAETNTITIIRGNDYKASDGRGLAFSSDSWPSLIGAVVTLILPGITITGVVLGTGAETTKWVLFELTAAQSRKVSTGSFRVDALQTDGDVISLIPTGVVTVG